MKHALSSEEFRPFKLGKKEDLTDCIKLFRFNYPEQGDDSGCKTGEYLSVRAHIEGQEIIRYYSPVSCPNETGHIDLLIKVDNDGGCMSKFLNELKAGDELEIKGPIAGFQYNANMCKRLGLIAGGTGISPCIQILRTINSAKGTDNTEVTLLYGSLTPCDIVFKNELEKMMEENKNIKVYFTVDKGDKTWNGRVGYIDKEMMKKCLPPIEEGTKLLMCGPGKMMQAISKQLHELGYTDDMFYKY